jgi:peroxiredoxin
MSKAQSSEPGTALGHGEPPPAGALARVRRWLPVAAIGLLLAYLLGAGFVRRHVDGLILRNQGQALPEFTLADQAGETWTKERLRGRPAVLHFLRSRCGSCDREAEDFRRFERMAADRAQVLHIYTDEVMGFAVGETLATIARKAFAAPSLIADAAFLDAFHSAKWSNVTPVTYVVDKAGTIREALRGGQSLAQLETALAGWD